MQAIQCRKSKCLYTLPPLQRKRQKPGLSTVPGWSVTFPDVLSIHDLVCTVQDVKQDVVSKGRNVVRHCVLGEGTLPVTFILVYEPREC